LKSKTKSIPMPF